MKKWIVLVIGVVTSIQLVAQSKVQDLVKEGIQYHDSGKYEEAIKKYEEALKIDPNSALVQYELSLSYLENKDYEKSIEYSSQVIDHNDEHKLPAIIVKGSALDELGKTQESIDLFNEAIKTQGDHYLLYYNLAVDYTKLKDYDQVDSNLLLALENNIHHASSHYLLAKFNSDKGLKIQSLLSSYFFLLIEPNSNRSAEILELIQYNLGSNVSKSEDKPNEINITLSPVKDNPFSAAELMMSLQSASSNLEENKDKSEYQLFTDQTKSLFRTLGELNKDKPDDIWWSFYIPFFSELAKSDHLETYTMYITQSSNEEFEQWMSQNEEQMDKFEHWLNNE